MKIIPIYNVSTCAVENDLKHLDKCELKSNNLATFDVCPCFLSTTKFDADS